MTELCCSAGSCVSTQCLDAYSGKECSRSSCSQLVPLLLDALLRPVKEFRSRLRARINCCREQERTVVVCLCCQLAACFVVDFRCQQKFLVGIIDKTELGFF